MLVSYRAVVEAKVHHGVFENIARGVLRAYDVPELAASLSPRPVWLVDAMVPPGRPLPNSAVETAHQAANVLRRSADESPSRVYPEIIR
jgi:hypothetical protein